MTDQTAPVHCDANLQHPFANVHRQTAPVSRKIQDTATEQVQANVSYESQLTFKDVAEPAIAVGGLIIGWLMSGFTSLGKANEKIATLTVRYDDLKERVDGNEKTVANRLDAIEKNIKERMDSFDRKLQSIDENGTRGMGRLEAKLEATLSSLTEFKEIYSRVNGVK